MRPGDALLLAALFLWVSVAVGPWWVGALIFAAGWVVNAAHAISKQKR